MNTFILAAVVAPLLYACINFIDKFMVSKVATSKSAWLFSGLFSGLIAVGLCISLVIFGKHIVLPIKEIGMILVAGVFQIVWLYFYFKALEGEDTSTVTPLFQLIGVFTYILGVLFLGEVLSIGKLVAIGLILLGGAFLFYDPLKKMAFKKEAGYITLAMFILSLSFVLFKKSIPELHSLDVVGISTFLVATMYMFLGMGVTSLIVFFVSRSFRSEFFVMWRQNSRRVFKVMTLAEVLNVVATLTVVYASLHIEVVKVTALESLQAFYVLVIGIVGTKYLPKYISESPLSRKALALKVLAIVIIVVGGFFLA